MGKQGSMTILKPLLSLVLLLSICAGGVAGQADTTANSIGLIVLSERYGRKDFVHIYNGDGSPWYSFSFYYDDRDGKFDYANEGFRPFAFHPDYFLLALKCVKREGGRYEVVVNEETGLRKYVRADDPTLRFETWESHILRVFSITLDLKENPVRNAPHGRVTKAPTRDGPFHPVEVKGEWLKIKWGPADGGRTAGSGWIRWKRGERLLVELFYFA